MFSTNLSVLKYKLHSINFDLDLIATHKRAFKGGSKVDDPQRAVTSDLPPDACLVR